MPHEPQLADPPATSSPGHSPQDVARPGVKLAVVATIACVAQFMVVLDSSIVNVALPSMKEGLSLSGAAQQWVVNGYLITFGGLLLLASRASDLFGRRRVFQAGLAVFTAASLFGGLAQAGWMLLAARLVQGAGAAALAPSSLSLITASHTEPAQRARAMTWWGVAAASAGAVGIVLGGLLTAFLSWRWVLLVNVPIGVGVFAATVAFLAPSAASGRRTRIDIPGAVTVTLAAAAIVYGVSAAPEHGWVSGQVLTALAGGIAAFAAFVAIEARTGEPLIPREVLAVHNIRIGNILTVFMGVVITTPLFFLSLYLQQVLGESALRTGMSLLPMACVMSVGVFVSQKLIPLIGPRRLVLAGGLIAAAGLVWLAQLPAHSAYALHVLAPTLVVAAGTSVTMMPGIVAATTGVAPRNAGVASGLINMCRQLGAALGLAVLVTVASAITSHSHAHGPAAVLEGYHTALLVVGAASVATALISLLLKGAEASRPELLIRQIFPRPAAAHAPWLLGHDVRTGARVVITGLNQNPAALAGAGQGESSGELAAVQKDGQVARLITDNLSIALIPDDHRARATRLPRPDPLIVTGGQGMVLDRHGQPPDTGIKRRSFGNCPRPEDFADLDPEIEMQRRRVVDLHHKARHRHSATLQPGIRTGDFDRCERLAAGGTLHGCIIQLQ